MASTFLLYSSAALMVAVALLHSTVGKRAFLDTSLRRRDLVPYAQAVSRFAWQSVTLFMLLNAMLVAWPGTPEIMIIVSGLYWFGMGIADLIIARGTHKAWFLLCGAGLLALAGALL